MLDNGSCHTDIVENVLNNVNNICKAFDITEKICIIKSTVIPGTTKKLNKKFKNISIIFNPEFLTEANAISDWKNQSRIILGGYYKITTKVKPIFAKVFPKITIVKTDSDYAEMVKYVTNTFLSTKVSFANEIYGICKSLDIDYDKVIEYAQYDDRLGKSHWSVPGPDGDFGYGGHCFPKDLSALIYLAEDLGLNPIVLQAIREKNNEVRNNRDWEKMEGRAIISPHTIKNKI